MIIAMQLVGWASGWVGGALERKAPGHPLPCHIHEALTRLQPVVTNRLVRKVRYEQPMVGYLLHFKRHHQTEGRIDAQARSTRCVNGEAFLFQPCAAQKLVETDQSTAQGRQKSACVINLQVGDVGHGRGPALNACRLISTSSCSGLSPPGSESFS